MRPKEKANELVVKFIKHSRAEKDIINIIKQDTFINGAKWQQQFNDTSEVTRVEVIQHSEPYNGRAYTNYNAKDVEIQFQDDGKTLKIFLR